MIIDLPESEALISVPTASVVVPTRDRSRDLAACLRSLLDQRIEGLCEIIIVDDGSTEPSADVLSQVGTRPNFNLRILRQEASGPAAARNLGIAHAASDLVAFTDSDAVHSAGWLAAAVDVMKRNPTAVGAEGRTLAVGRDATVARWVVENVSGGRYLTCNMIYRRAALIQVGGFDAAFLSAHAEDTDLAERIKSRGEILWVPEMLVYHPARRLTPRAILTEPLTRVTANLRLRRKHPSTRRSHPLVRPSWALYCAGAAASFLLFAAHAWAAAGGAVTVTLIAYGWLVRRNLVFRRSAIGDYVAAAAAYALQPFVYLAVVAAAVAQRRQVGNST